MINYNIEILSIRSQAHHILFKFAQRAIRLRRMHCHILDSMLNPSKHVSSTHSISFYMHPNQHTKCEINHWHANFVSCQYEYDVLTRMCGFIFNNIIRLKHCPLHLSISTREMLSKKRTNSAVIPSQLSQDAVR